MSINLYAQCHDRVDNIVVVLLQSLDSLVARNTGLGHNQLDILVLKTGSINLLLILLFLLLLGLSTLNSLTLTLVRVVVARVVVTSVVVRLSSGKLLSSGSLSLGVKVLNLSLTEDAVGLVSTISVIEAGLTYM